jgi:hypothetical protein
MRRFQWVVIAAGLAAACGGGGGTGDDGAGDDGAGDDGSGDDGGGDDGGGDDTGPDPDAGGGGDDAGPTPDGGGGPAVDCEPGIAPTNAVVMSSISNLNFVEIVTAGGRVFATAPFGVPASTWLRWTGSAWSQEPIPWPPEIPAASGVGRVVQLASGDAIITVNGATGTWITVFDGFEMSPGVEAPASAGNPWAFTRTSDGMLHVFGTIGTSTGNLHVEVAQNPAGGWYPAAPLPVPGSSNDEVAIATTDDRLVVAWTNVFFDADDPVHVHVTSRGPTTTWTAEQDITPTWAVRAYRLHAVAPRNGGAILGASGAGSVVWLSPDGVTFGEYEQASAYGFLSGIHAQCLEHPIVVAGYQTSYRMEARVGGSWTTLKDRTLSYIDNAGAVILPDGKTYFALGESNQHEYFATP